MPLSDPTSILRQTILLFYSLPNLGLMIFRYNWFLGIAFLTAAFCASLAPSLYLAIALLFFGAGLILLIFSKTNERRFSWQIEGGIKNTLVLASLIVLCLLVPQVETDMANFRNPTDTF